MSSMTHATNRLVLLPSALLVSLALLPSCQSNDTPPKPRTNAVTATKDGKTAAATKTAATSKPTAQSPAKPARDLCQGQSPLDDPPGELSISRAADGATAPPPVAYGKGRWTWINVWAAWCEPCKKEMPMLLAWKKKLASKGVALDLVFVSIDDDERELNRFLASQPKDGVRASYWVTGEEAQATFFESLGFEDTPKLPVHAFVSPEGKTSCVVEGSVEESDYASVAKLTGG
jgi:thiol-disulfide isomerase/thioredoxin